MVADTQQLFEGLYYFDVIFFLTIRMAGMILGNLLKVW